MIRVLIVDDSITQREILRKLLESDADFTVVGEARDGSLAIERVKALLPDVVLMDVHMPVMDGIEATRQIMRECPVPIVIASATLRKRDIDHGLAALEAGAISIIQKPKGAALLHLKKIGPELREALLAAAQARVVKRAEVAPHSPDQTGEDKSAPRLPMREHAKIDIVGICTSTGGPPILVEILSALPTPFPLPILLVQHISEPFIEGFATWLANMTGQNVQIAGDKQRLDAGIWLAEPGNHLTLANRSRIALLPKSPADIHCPSGNPLFSSLAQHFAQNAVGVQLTGMGDDGARGLLELKQAGGQTLIQDEASCMIYGMPKVAKELHAGTHELSPSRIADFLSQLVASRMTNG